MGAASRGRLKWNGSDSGFFAIVGPCAVTATPSLETRANYFDSAAKDRKRLEAKAVSSKSAAPNRALYLRAAKVRPGLW
jgi:hypothetical protein